MLKIHRNTLLLSTSRVVLEELPIEETCVYLKSRLCLLARRLSYKEGLYKVRIDAHHLRRHVCGCRLSQNPMRYMSKALSLLLAGVEAEIITTDVIDGA